MRFLFSFQLVPILKDFNNEDSFDYVYAATLYLAPALAEKQLY